VAVGGPEKDKNVKKSSKDREKSQKSFNLITLPGREKRRRRGSALKLISLASVAVGRKKRTGKQKETPKEGRDLKGLTVCANQGRGKKVQKEGKENELKVVITKKKKGAMMNSGGGVTSV